MSEARLYGLALSPPALAACMALERKGVDFGLTNLMPGMHPVAVRAVGFRGPTVPALKIDGRKVQGSREITAYLERTRPEPPLFGATPEERARIEEAERWGEQELQHVPRRILRLAATRDASVCRWLAEGIGLPAPGAAAVLMRPAAIGLARQADATEAQVRAALAQLPQTLDRLDALVAQGTIGGPEPNAADMQILTTVRSMTEFAELAPYLAGRPVTAAAERLVEKLPGPMPRCIPEAWLPPLPAAA